jgi:hypothetical protein
VTEQQKAVGERGVRTTPRSVPRNGRPFSRTIECDESAPEAKRSAAVTRARGARRGPDETEGASRRE